MDNKQKRIQELKVIIPTHRDAVKEMGLNIKILNESRHFSSKLYIQSTIELLKQLEEYCDEYDQLTKDE